jgi:hypothetical protein
MKHELKTLDILSTGKIIGILYAAMMLLFVPFALIFMVVGIIGGISGEEEMFGMAVMGAFFLFSPVIYGVMGFIMGVIGALVYNLVAKWFGGLVFETSRLEEK